MCEWVWGSGRSPFYPGLYPTCDCFFFSVQELRDPRELAAEMDSEEAMKGLAMNEMLSELHGARGFKEFVLTKKSGSIMPSFLEKVNLNSTNAQSQRQHLTRT